MTARNREPDAKGVDPILGAIDASDYDQVWLFGVDVGGDTGIGAPECKALSDFRRLGGAMRRLGAVDDGGHGVHAQQHQECRERGGGEHQVEAAAAV